MNFVFGTEDDGPREVHELHGFMQQASAQMDAEYARIRRRVREDPGTAGDEGEENWAMLLRSWLPASYHVRTKGRLLDHKGKLTPQVDVVVLRPSYPPALLEKKVYLAGGVAAAFECKLTLNSGHIADAVGRAAVIKASTPQETGTPYRELRANPVFGLLAHSHSWKTPNAAPARNVSRSLVAADAPRCSHPRLMLDLACVSDLGTWCSPKPAGLGPAYLGPHWPLARDAHGLPDEGGVLTCFVGPDDTDTAKSQPIGVMFAWLLRLLAREDASLRPISEYFNVSGLLGSGGGISRPWTWDVYSESVRDQARDGGPISGDRWSEWVISGP